jgi:hypothetical protein
MSELENNQEIKVISSKKEMSVTLATFLLMKQGYVPYIPCVKKVGHDIIAIKDGTLYKIVVLSVNENDPIITLRTQSSGKMALRDFDVLMAINSYAMIVYMIPAEDVPDKESLRLGKRYEGYKQSFFTLENIVKSTPVLMEAVKKKEEKIIKDLKELCGDEKSSDEDAIRDLL